MRRRHPIVVTALALSLSLGGGLNPAFGSGLITTEEVLAAAPAAAGHTVEAQRRQLHEALIAAGVEAGFAAQRLGVLSDAEIARLSHDLREGPAGGLWFMPFLVVAAVIGVLIGTSRNADSPKALPTTDLFGRPLNVANVP